MKSQNKASLFDFCFLFFFFKVVEPVLVCGVYSFSFD